MTRFTRPLCAFAASTLVAFAAGAIVGRHDRADADYLALAARAPAVARVSPDGAGVLVAPRWVLTAAHVAQEASVFSSVEIAGERLAVTGRALHPSWRGDPAPGTHDLALLELARPAQAPPVALFDGADEIGRRVFFFGWGDSGFGDRGPERNDSRLRGAENRVEAAGPAAVRFRFDAPPAGEPLEGVSGPGDSGGPALVEVAEGDWQVLGVSSGASGEPGRYGIEEIYARVSTARDWIGRTIAGGLEADERFAPARTIAGAAELSPAGGEGVARAFVAATASASPAALLAFDRSHRTAAALARRTDADREATYRELLATHGELTPLAVGAERDGRLPLLVRGATSGDCLGFVFLLEDEPTKLDGYFSGPAACSAGESAGGVIR
jgi:hypothetical protein